MLLMTSRFVVAATACGLRGTLAAKLCAGGGLSRTSHSRTQWVLERAPQQFYTQIDRSIGGASTIH